MIFVGPFLKLRYSGTCRSDTHNLLLVSRMKKVKSLSCPSRLGLRNGMKIYVSEMCAVRLVSASTVTYIYI